MSLLHTEEAVNGLATVTCLDANSNVIHNVAANEAPTKKVLLSSQNENYRNKSAHRFPILNLVVPVLLLFQLILRKILCP